MEAIIRPEDGELCGHVAEDGDGWRALTVFGGVLGVHASREVAVDQVRREGLASLAERWTLRSAGGDEEVVCIQEADPESVTVALGYYSMPGVPTVTITAAELAAGTWRLER